MHHFNDAPLVVGRDDRITVTVSHWVEPQKRGGGFSLPACSYGVMLTVNGEAMRHLWGSGYAPDPIPPIALAVARILGFVQSPFPVTVNTIPQFSLYWGPGGFVRDAMRRSGRTNSGKKLAAYRTMRALEEALDAMKWRLGPHAGMSPSRAFCEASNLATGIGKERALAHKAEYNPTPADCPGGAVILEGGTI